MAKIAYYRCSTRDQSIEHQRNALGNEFDREFQDDGVSGAIVAAKRPGFAKMLEFMREGDTVFVTAIDRLGRDSIDIQQTYRDRFKAKNVRLFVAGLGHIKGEMGELVLALLAQFAQMERNRVIERTQSGRALAKDSLARTGLTHRGKSSLGRPREHDASTVNEWRRTNGASISVTAKHFDISTSSVKRFARTGTEPVSTDA
jgi:putative DNA-invertase from lambdoid prophage Rac